MKVLIKIFVLGILASLVFFFSSKSITPTEKNELLEKILKEEREASDARIKYYEQLLSEKGENGSVKAPEIGENTRKALQELWKEGGAVDFFASTEKTSSDEFKNRATKFTEEFNIFLGTYVPGTKVMGPAEEEALEEGVLEMGLPPTPVLGPPEELPEDLEVTEEMIMPPAPPGMPGMEAAMPTPPAAELPPPPGIEMPPVPGPEMPVAAAPGMVEGVPEMPLAPEGMGEISPVPDMGEIPLPEAVTVPTGMVEEVTEVEGIEIPETPGMEMLEMPEVPPAPAGMGEVPELPPPPPGMG